MAKTTGFLEYERETAAERPLVERTADWEPIQLTMAEGQLTTQAARCMDCGTPFCHTGQVLNGMASGCPLNNLIPEWNDLVYQGLWREAYERLSKTNNFPEFTGQVCPAPCEAACTLGIVDPAVTIKNIEQAIIEKAFVEGWVRSERPARRTGKRVAVVGSGPAGLACADQLNRVGHEVTVFERDDRVGGLLMYGIPNMKLAKGAVQRRVALLTEAGIVFRTGVEVGVDVTAVALRRDFDAIVVCTGASQPRDLPAAGRELQGIHFAMPFLTASTKRLLANGERQTTDSPSVSPSPQPPVSNLHAFNKDVIVIGGGDTGTDCVATALRQGCRSLTQFEITEQLPLIRPLANPWPQWPRVHKTGYGQAEAAALYGRDPRRYAVMTKRFAGDETGQVTAVHTVQVAWQGHDLVEIPKTEKVWPAQLVLLAMGFLGVERPLLAQLGVNEAGVSGNGRYQTNSEAVFIAGDARRGQSLVVWAIDEGRGAAREVDFWLMGETDLP